MGVGPTSVGSATIERTVRPWLWGAILLLVLTGLLMGSVLADKLYHRPVFLVKMLSLAAALLLSLGVTASIARQEGTVPSPAKILTGTALAIWLFAVSIFATSYGPAPGGIHLIFAGWLIVMGYGSQKTRIILGSITAIIVVVFGIVTGIVYNSIDNYDFVIEADRWTVRFGALLVSGFLFWEFAKPPTKEDDTPRLARLLGLFTTLAWATVAASGRWIGLGGASGRILPRQ